MATKKKNSSRKALAVALGIVGVAGLSLASAAQLTVDASNEVAIGVDTFAPCHTTGDIAVSYAYDSTDFIITNVTVADIDVACNLEDIRLVLKDGAGVVLFNTTGTVAAGAFTYDATLDAIDIATDLGEVTVVIG